MILLLIITVLIGWAFYRLAHDYYRSEWGFALLGGGVFIAGHVVFSFITGIVLALTGNADVLLTSGGVILITIVVLAIDFIACGILYALLKRSWSKNPKNQKGNDIIDQ